MCSRDPERFGNQWENPLMPRHLLYTWAKVWRKCKWEGFAERQKKRRTSKKGKQKSSLSELERQIERHTRQTRLCSHLQPWNATCAFHPVITGSTSSASQFASAGTYMCSRTRDSQFMSGQQSWGGRLDKEGWLAIRAITILAGNVWLLSHSSQCWHKDTSLWPHVKAGNAHKCYWGPGIPEWKQSPVDYEAHYIQESATTMCS